VKRSQLLLLLALAAAACTPDPLPETGTAPERIGCGVPHCSLHLPAGVIPVGTDDDALRVLEHAATGVRMQVRVLESAPSEPAGIAPELARLLDREEARLAPAVRFSQPPQGPLGIVVRGVSGTLQQDPGRTAIDPGANRGAGRQPAAPVRVQLLSYASPATGRVLVLRARGAEPQWSLAWPELGNVARDIRLEEGF
jgi:hypothetical protein